MDGESRYAAEAASLKQAELARTLETLEKKDALREKAVRAFCVPVRASRCECGRVFEGVRRRRAPRRATARRRWRRRSASSSAARGTAGSERRR